MYIAKNSFIKLGFNLNLSLIIAEKNFSEIIFMTSCFQLYLAYLLKLKREKTKLTLWRESLGIWLCLLMDLQMNITKLETDNRGNMISTLYTVVNSVLLTQRAGL